MASFGRRQGQGWEDQIESLPAEILSYDVREIPPHTLTQISIRLHPDSVSEGNWESLAEKLGFLQNSVLETLIQQARVQNTYPGLLMLKEWSRRSGSTAHVLLHALREIRREDCVTILVKKLFELLTMSLQVCVQDREGGAPQFLNVPTQKSAPLHASLYNTLSRPPYWYDIVGPRHDITWNTPSSELQGTQLSLRVRPEPSQNSMEEIYGTSAGLSQPQPTLPLVMNIPPEQPKQSQEGKEWNELSRSRIDDSQSPFSNHFPPHTPNHHTLLSSPLTTTATPAAAAFRGPEANPVCVDQMNPDSALNSFQPMTQFPSPPVASSSHQQFPRFSTLMSSNFHLSGSGSLSSLQSSADTSSNNVEYQPSSETGLKEPVNLPPSTTTRCLGGAADDETLLKHPLRPAHEGMNISDSGGGGGGGGDDSKAREPLQQGQNIGAMEHDEMALGLPEIVPPPPQPANNSSRSSPVAANASSHMHHQYVKIIQFCNNPTSPHSLDSNPSSLGSLEAGGGTRANDRPQFSLPSPSSEQVDLANQLQQQLPHHQQHQQGFSGFSPNELRTAVSPGDYIPHHVIEHLSRSLNARGGEEDQEEESMQIECSESEYVTAEGLNNNSSAVRNGSSSSNNCRGFQNQEPDTYSQFSAIAAAPSTSVGNSHPGSSNTSSNSSSRGHKKPTPCTYTQCRLGGADNNNCQQHGGFSPSGLPEFPSPDARPMIPHSLSVDSGGNPTYMDMRGSGGGGRGDSTTPHPHLYPHRPNSSTGIHASQSIGSYMNTHRSSSRDGYDQFLLEGGGGGDGGGSRRNASTPNLPHLLLHSRNRNPLPPMEGSDVVVVGGDGPHQPRDRRPLTQNQEMLLDGGERSPEPEYTYIDAASVSASVSAPVSAPPHVPRRASESALSPEVMMGMVAGGRGAVASASSATTSSSTTTATSPSVSTPSAVRRRRSEGRGDPRCSLSPAELEQVPGWNPNITDRTVEEEMSRYINDDGNFTVWQYTTGRKYVISVSHLRSIRHYAVYESERERKIIYYIFPKGPRFSSLAALVIHCQTHGVAEPTKTFKTPDGSQAPQSSSGSGRFSHVRLRYPIPARRH